VRRLVHDPVSRRTFLRISSALAVGIASGGASRLFAAPARPIERSAFIMGSIVTITAYGPEGVTEAAVREAFGAMKEVDAMMSVYLPTSALSRLNSGGASGPVAVPEELSGLLGEALRYHRQTGGAFDVTVKPLLDLYGFLDAPAPHQAPTDREIARVLEGVGMGNLVVDAEASTVAFARPGTRVDLGGIAVGHALDRAGKVLRARGVEAALLNHSGDLLAVGAPPDEESWEIGITDPLRPGRVITTTAIRNEALATSGNYRNVRRIGRRVFGHIFDPSAGRPADEILSSTIIAPTATAADALSTGTFVLGRALAPSALAGGRMIAVGRGDAPGTERIL
jgi:thiamine biosynthesis lipoprotein